ncbi:hypothetical protein N2152v2_008625 [Parachlorella kessleri]
MSFTVVVTIVNLEYELVEDMATKPTLRGDQHAADAQLSLSRWLEGGPGSSKRVGTAQEPPAYPVDLSWPSLKLSEGSFDGIGAAGGSGSIKAGHLEAPASPTFARQKDTQSPPAAGHQPGPNTPSCSPGQVSALAGQSGPPHGADQLARERCCSDDGVGAWAAPWDPRLKAVVKLLRNVFQVPAAAVAAGSALPHPPVKGPLIGLHSGRGAAVDPSSHPCDWFADLARPGEPLVIEDATLDARLQNGNSGNSPPGVRFYASAPLKVGSGRGRLRGRVCVFDFAPRRFLPQEQATLVLIAELIAAEMEKEEALHWHQVALQEAQHTAQQAQQAEHDHSMQLLRVMDGFQEGVLLCDTSHPSWPVLYINDAFAAALGTRRGSITSSAALWDLFKVTPSQGKPAVPAVPAAMGGLPLHAKGHVTGTSPHAPAAAAEVERLPGEPPALGAAAAPRTELPAAAEAITAATPFSAFASAAYQQLAGSFKFSSDGAEVDDAEQPVRDAVRAGRVATARLSPRNAASPFAGAGAGRLAEFWPYSALGSAGQSQASLPLRESSSTELEISLLPPSGVSPGAAQSSSPATTPRIGNSRGNSLSSLESPTALQDLLDQCQAQQAQQGQQQSVAQPNGWHEEQPQQQASELGQQGPLQQLHTDRLSAGTLQLRHLEADGATRSASPDDFLAEPLPSLPLPPPSAPPAPQQAWCFVVLRASHHPDRAHSRSPFASGSGTPLGTADGHLLAAALAGNASPGPLGSRTGSRAAQLAQVLGLDRTRTGALLSSAGSRRGSAYRTPGGAQSFKLMRPKELDDVVLGPMIGSGSFGRCYRGNWHGATVAVKASATAFTHIVGQALATRILDCWADPPREGEEEEITEAEVEALLSRSLAHPYIVNTFQYGRSRQASLSRWVGMEGEHGGTGGGASLAAAGVFLAGGTLPSSSDPPGCDPQAPSSARMGRGGRQAAMDVLSIHQLSPLPPSSPGAGPETEQALAGKVHQQVWIVQAFCNRGTLLDAIEKGSFCGADGKPCLFHVLQTASEIAGAMDYLHGMGLLHGDLTPNNVLLSSSSKDIRRWIAQVADFGLAQAVRPGETIHTESFGTITHMPPELLIHGTLSPAVDVYSFGVILWEMWALCHAWQGRTALQVMHAVCIKKQVLEPREDAPPRLQRLMARCLDPEPGRRPSFEAVLADLGDQLRALRPDRRGSLQVPPALTASGSSEGRSPSMDGGRAGAPSPGEGRIPGGEIPRSPRQGPLHRASTLGPPSDVLGLHPDRPYTDLFAAPLSAAQRLGPAAIARH